MCPHGYHHSGSMATPALGTRDVRLHIVWIALWSHQSAQTASSERCIVQKVNVLQGGSPPNPRECSNCTGSERNIYIYIYIYIQRITMCPHGYHHSGSLSLSLSLSLYIYIYIYIYISALTLQWQRRAMPWSGNSTCQVFDDVIVRMGGFHTGQKHTTHHPGNPMGIYVLETY